LKSNKSVIGITRATAAPLLVKQLKVLFFPKIRVHCDTAWQRAKVVAETA
jgi:hypothetical protein